MLVLRFHALRPDARPEPPPGEYHGPPGCPV